MDQQRNATEEAAKAAILNARAAIENIEMFISKERARLRVEPKNLSLDIQHGVAYRLEVVVSMYGPTTAFITGSGFSVDIVPTESVGIPKPHGFWIPMLIPPKVISPSSEPITIGTLHPILLPGKTNPTSEIKEGSQFVEIQGFITYKDVFDRDRVTNFRYVWRYVRWLEGRANYGVGVWNKCGTLHAPADCLPIKTDTAKFGRFGAFVAIGGHDSKSHDAGVNKGKH
jgi:hypothetical protein